MASRYNQTSYPGVTNPLNVFSTAADWLQGLATTQRPLDPNSAAAQAIAEQQGASAADILAGVEGAELLPIDMSTLPQPRLTTIDTGSPLYRGDPPVGPPASLAPRFSGVDLGEQAPNFMGPSQNNIEPYDYVPLPEPRRGLLGVFDRFKGGMERLGSSEGFSRIEQTLNNPITRMGLNMMQQSAVPGQGFGAGFGRAGLQTMAQLDARQKLMADTLAARASAIASGRSAASPIGKLQQDMSKAITENRYIDAAAIQATIDKTRGGWTEVQSHQEIEKFYDRGKSASKVVSDSLNSLQMAKASLDAGSAIGANLEHSRKHPAC